MIDIILSNVRMCLGYEVFFFGTWSKTIKTKICVHFAHTWYILHEFQQGSILQGSTRLYYCCGCLLWPWHQGTREKWQMWRPRWPRPSFSEEICSVNMQVSMVTFEPVSNGNFGRSPTCCGNDFAQRSEAASMNDKLYFLNHPCHPCRVSSGGEAIQEGWRRSMILLWC